MHEPTIRELLISQKHTQATLDQLVQDFKPVQKHVHMVNGAVKLLSLISLLTGIAVAAVSLSGCGAPKHTKTRASEERLSQLKEVRASLLQQATGWPSEQDCDGALWAGIQRRAGVASTDLTQALTKEGRPLRKPGQDCGPVEEGLAGDSAATTSSDMILGIVLGLHAASGLDHLELLFSYGQDNEWIMGKPASLVSRVLLKPTGIGMLAQAIYHLGGTDRAARLIPSPILPVEKDYEEHLQILSVLLQRDEGRNPSLPSTCTSRPNDALIQAVCANYSRAAELLVGESPTGGGYIYPSYVRGETDASTAAYQRAHWLLAAQLILEGEGHANP